MKKVIHLKTARVTSQNNDGTVNIERLITKHEAGSSFEKVVKHLKLNNYIAKEPPTVVKAMENINGEWKQIDHSEYQKMVEKEYNSEPKFANIDYKAKSEQQEKENSELKQLIASFEERLKNVEKAGEKEYTEEEREELIKKYEAKFQKKPGRMKTETIETKLNEE